MQDPNETFNNIEQNTEMALLQSEKIAESVDNLEPIMEGVLVKTDEMVQEMKKSNDKPVNETKIIFEGVEMTEIRGRDGKDGEKGDKGDTGIQGSKGEKGDKGDHGEKGDKGEDGTNGYDGRDGLDGYDGKDGQDGIDGRDGVDGKDGKDGTEIKAEEIKQKLESLEIGLDYEKLSNVPDIAKVARMASSKTVSLIELDDVDYSGLTKTNGKYVLGGGDGTTTTINGLSGAVTLSAGNNVTLNESGNDIEITANFTQEGKYMISGGITWSGTGLIYDVSFLNYFFNGNKTSNPTQVTLDASDPTNNRFDAIVVDEAGTVTAITGTASANPEVPAIPEDQLQVTIILVAAGSTTPTIASEEIYMDDPTTNWTFSTYTTGAPTGSIDFAGVNSPKQGVNDIEASTDSRLGARFVRGTSFDAFQYTMLQVWVRFTGTAVATNKSLNVRFENSAGTLVGSTVNLFSYGLQRGVLNTWQLVVVPITAFGALPATVKGLKMIMAGGTVGVVRQWNVDYMLLTDGSTPFTNIPTIAFYKDNTGIASQSGLNIKQGLGGATIAGVNNPTLQAVDYTFNAFGGDALSYRDPITKESTIAFNFTDGDANVWTAGFQELLDVGTGFPGVRIGGDNSAGDSVSIGFLDGSGFSIPSGLFMINATDAAGNNNQIGGYAGGGQWSVEDATTGGAAQLGFSASSVAMTVVANVSADDYGFEVSNGFSKWIHHGNFYRLPSSGTLPTIGQVIGVTNVSGNVVSTEFVDVTGSPLTSTYVGYGDGSNALTGSADMIFNSATKTFSVGDLTSSANETSLVVDDANQIINLQASGGGSITQISLNNTARSISIGDVIGNNNGTTFILNDTTKGISGQTTGVVQFGDIGGALNALFTKLDGANIVFSVNRSSAKFLNIDIANTIYSIGDLSGSNNDTKIIIDDATMLITVSNVPTYADDAAATTGGLTTGNLYKTTTGGITSLNIVP